MSLQGTLKTLGITEVLEFLAARNATGQLDVTTEMGTAAYLFADGQVAQSEYSFIREIGTDPAEATYYVVSELDGTFFFDEEVEPVDKDNMEDVAEVLSRTAEIAEKWLEIESVIETPNHLLVRNDELDGSVTIQPEWWTALEVIGSGKTSMQVAANLELGLLDASMMAYDMANAGLLNVEEIDPTTLEVAPLDLGSAEVDLPDLNDLAVEPLAPLTPLAAPAPVPAPAPAPRAEAVPAPPVEVAPAPVEVAAAPAVEAAAPAPPIVESAPAPAPEPVVDVAPAVAEAPASPFEVAPAPTEVAPAPVPEAAAFASAADPIATPEPAPVPVEQAPVFESAPAEPAAAPAPAPAFEAAPAPAQPIASDDDGWASNHSPSYDAGRAADAPSAMAQPVAPEVGETNAVAGEVMSDLASLSDQLEEAPAANWQLDGTFVTEEPTAPAADENPFGDIGNLVEGEGEEDRGSVLKFLRRD